MNFLEKYEILKKSIPVPALKIKGSVECEYADEVDESKNCYYCFDSTELIDGMYTTLGIWSKKLVDCTSVTESEKCYQCVDCTKCYNSTYLIDCNRSTDCHFSAFLNSCTDCFDCIGLTHKKYCIFNIQYTKEEYFKKIEKLKQEKSYMILEQMHELKKNIPHPASEQFNTQNCLYGNYIYDSKNCYWVFNSYYCENSGYHFISARAKNCWDFYYSGASDKNHSTERCYELILSGDNCYNCAFLTSNSRGCTNCFYGTNLMNCSDCWGCVGLTNKKYCILNNLLTKEQYAKAVKDIKKELGWRV